MGERTTAAKDEKLRAARNALLAALPRLKPGGDNCRAIKVLTFEPMPMREIVHLGRLGDTCYDFLNRCTARGLVNKPSRGAYSLKTEGALAAADEAEGEDAEP